MSAAADPNAPTGSSVASAAAVVERDPAERLQEVLDYLSHAYVPGFKGTAVFEIPATPVNPRTVFHIACDPARGAVSRHGAPPDGRYSVWTTMSRDDFFYLDSGAAGPGAGGWKY